MMFKGTSFIRCDLMLIRGCIAGWVYYCTNSTVLFEDSVMVFLVSCVTVAVSPEYCFFSDFIWFQEISSDFAIRVTSAQNWTWFLNEFT